MGGGSIVKAFSVYGLIGNSLLVIDGGWTAKQGNQVEKRNLEKIWI